METSDSITSRGNIGGALRDTLKGDYDVVGVVGDGKTESNDFDDAILEVVRS